MSAATTSPDIDQWWDFRDPAGSEARFRRELAAAREGGDVNFQAALLTQIARALGLQGRFEAGHATLDEVEKSLHRNLLATRVRVALERGRLFNSAGDRDRARALFQLAFDEAIRAKAEALAIDAAHMVAIASPANEAIEWNSRALDLAERATEPRARRWRASLNNNLGWNHHDRGDFASALIHFERAVAQRREQGVEAEVQVARWCVARTLRSLGQIETALAAQRALEREHAASGTSDGFVQEEIAECLLALGRSTEAAPHFAAAHAMLSADPSFEAREPDRLSRLSALASRANPA